MIKSCSCTSVISDRNKYFLSEPLTWVNTMLQSSIWVEDPSNSPKGQIMQCSEKLFASVETDTSTHMHTLPTGNAALKGQSIKFFLNSWALQRVRERERRCLTVVPTPCWFNLCSVWMGERQYAMGRERETRRRKKSVRKGNRINIYRRLYKSTGVGGELFIALRITETGRIGEWERVRQTSESKTRKVNG